MPLPNIARFIHQDAIAPALTNLFGDDSWLLARTAGSGREAERMLHDIFLARLKTRAGLARSFEMDGSGGWSGYHLFFGTRHPSGLLNMKYAMWRIDPGGGARFADATNPDQLTLLGGTPDLSPLRAALMDAFGTRWFTIEEAEAFVLIDTPYHPGIHLKTLTLKPLEVDGLLEARNRKKARTYPAKTRLRFTPR